MGKTKVKLIRTPTNSLSAKNSLSLKRYPDDEDESGFDEEEEEKEYSYSQKKEDLIEKTDELMESKETFDSAANGAQFMDKALEMKMKSLDTLMEDASVNDQAL